MMVEVRLENDLGYKWFYSREADKDVWLKGFFIKDEHVYFAQDFLGYVSGCTRENLIESCRVADGHFLIVVCDSEGVIVVSDHMRSFPVLIVKRENGYCVTDAISAQELHNSEFDDLQRSAFENALYTFGEKTLCKDITQVPAGSYCTISEAGITYEAYWQFRYAEKQILDKKQAVGVLADGYDKLFATCKELIGERNVVIPLSGGYDSRLILNGLLQNGVEKERIITFTYGRSDYEDRILSEKIAKAVGVRHYFINYCTKDARKFFAREFARFSYYAAMLVSVPCIQEWYAVSVLKEQGIINENCVFMPGYGGILPGHYIQAFMFQDDVDMKQLIRKYIRKTMLSNKAGSSKNELAKLQDIIMESKHFTADDNHDINYIESYERLIYLEEQSKFILNAVRDYEYVGCEWITPFFFKMQYDVWSQIDNTLRLNNKAYMQCMESYFMPELKEIPFTGSKIKRKSKTKFKIFRIVLWLLKLCFNREEIHYLFGMIPNKVFYKTILKNKFVVSINYLVGCEYYKNMIKHKK